MGSSAGTATASWAPAGTHLALARCYPCTYPHTHTYLMHVSLGTCVAASVLPAEPSPSDIPLLPVSLSFAPKTCCCVGPQCLAVGRFLREQVSRKEAALLLLALRPPSCVGTLQFTIDVGLFGCEDRGQEAAAQALPLPGGAGTGSMWPWHGQLSSTACQT